MGFVGVNEPGGGRRQYSKDAMTHLKLDVLDVDSKSLSWIFSLLHTQRLQNLRELWLSGTLVPEFEEGEAFDLCY